MDTVLCWTHCILDIYLVLLLQLSSVKYTFLASKYAKHFSGSSITHKDDHFAKKKTALKLDVS